MKRHLNERGSALLLALFLVFLVSILSVSLLTVAMQGHANSIKGENIEAANYAAESGAAITMRALKESVVKQKLSLEQTQIDAFIADFNTKPLTLDHKPRLTFGAVPGESYAYTLTSTRSVGADKLAKEKAVTLRFKLVPGTNNAAGAIFGKDIVASDDPPTHGSNDVFLTEDGSKPQVDKSLAFNEYKALFLDYYESKMATRPLPLTPLQPQSVPLGNYQLAAGNYTINATPHASALYSGKISSGLNRLVVNGDIVAGDDFTFGGNELEINGNLIVGGSITFNSYLNKLKVTGNMIAGKTISFNSSSVVEIGGSISSQDAISFNGINDSDKGLTVGKSIIAEKGISFSNLNKLTVADTISSQKNITVSGSLGEGSIRKSIVAGGDISFANISKLRVGSSLSANGSIGISGNIAEMDLPNGSIIGGSNISFATISRMNVAGSISGAQNVQFGDNITDAAVGGSIFAPGTLGFYGINKLSVGDSLLAGSKNGSTGFDFRGKQVSSLYVGGTILSTNKIDFPPMNKLNVGSFVGSIDKITWGNLDNGYGTAHVGGITTGKQIHLTSSWKPQGGVIIKYAPPDGSGGGEPTIDFNGWSSK